MSELVCLFSKIVEFYDRSLLWEQVEEIYEQETNGNETKKETPAEKQNADFVSLPVLKRALKEPLVLSTLLELCTAIRNLRNDDSCEKHESWEEIIKTSQISRDAYLAFIYALAGLATVDWTSSQYTKLSLAAVNTYLLSLAVPGAKGFRIFEEDVIIHCLQVFALVERLQNPEQLKMISKQQSLDIWVRFTVLCDDLRTVLRYVHFDDYKNTRDALLKKLLQIQYLNHERGYANQYAANLHQKCFEIFDEVINAHNGEPEETLTRLMNMTIFLHTHQPKPKGYSGYNALNENGDNPTSYCEHISDWFIRSIAKYPRLLVKVLNLYIESMVTNPVKSWKAEQFQRALEYAAKYDAAMFTKCNESCVEFLSDALRADEVTIRARAIDLMARILLLESQVDWQMFRHEVSGIPREVHIIKELIETLQDLNNTAKLKAVQALHNALTRGSPNAKKVLSEGIRFARFSNVDIVLPDEPRVGKNEIRYEKPVDCEANYTFEGHGLVELSFIHLPEYVYNHLYQNSLSYIRRAGIMFAEQMVRLNPLVIYNTNFIRETISLTTEPTALVRKQTLATVDGLLGCYPNCYQMIWLWCKIIAPMLHDGDPKNIDMAMECFRCRVLMNMNSIDQSNKAEHFMPWIIIRTLLTTQSRLYLQTCFHSAFQQRMITPKILRVIESHLITSNSTEAWVLLNFMAGKVKALEPDTLIHHFTSLQSWNKETNMVIALEVLASSIAQFSHTALNHAFRHILAGIKNGKTVPTLIAKSFDFLLLINNRSSANDDHGDALDIDGVAWIVDIHELLETKILIGIEQFPADRYTLVSYLFAYSEVNLHTNLRPNDCVVSFIHKFIRECLKLPENELNMENEQLFNLMTVLAGRFSLRDPCVANQTCILYGAILRTIDRPPIVNTIVIALLDVAKKHTELVERIIDRVIAKLSSPYEVNRIETFKCFERLILQDQIKLRGSLLVHLLACLLDTSRELTKRAGSFFREYLAKKNSTLFQKCLNECPYVLNEYKNFEGMDSCWESVITSPLKGEDKSKDRQTLYNQLMAEMDDIILILNFSQLKGISEKSKNDPLMKSPEGVSLLKDVLFILVRVCQLTKDQKPSAANSGNNEDGDDNALAGAEIGETNAAGETTVAATTSAAAGGGGGRGGRKKREVTMPEAMSMLEKSLVFIPRISDNLLSYDDTLVKSFDELGYALAKRFPNLVEFAQPNKFWKKYYSKAAEQQKAKKRKLKLNSKSNKKDRATESADSQSEYSSNSDEEEQRKPKKRTRQGNAESNQTDRTAEVDSDSGASISSHDETGNNNDTSFAELARKTSKPANAKAFESSELLMRYLFQPNI